MPKRTPAAAPQALERLAVARTLSTEASPNAGLWRLLASIIQRLPHSPKPTQNSSRKAAQPSQGFTLSPLRLTLLIVGLLFVLASERNIAIIILGFFTMASAAILPLPHARRNAWLNALKARQTRQRAVDSPAKLVHDGRRLELWLDDKLDRRVLTNRPFVIKTTQHDGLSFVGVMPPKSNKREAIWFALPATTTLPATLPTSAHLEPPPTPHVILTQDAAPLLDLLVETANQATQAKP